MQKFALALGVLVLPFAFHSVQAQAVETKNGTAVVSGRVTLKGEPALGVMVILQTQNQNTSNAPRARTDESGRFYFTRVPAGRHSVLAVAPGYVSPEDANFSGLRGKTLNLAEGEKVENVDLEIKRGGVIAGQVTDSQGLPVIEERVNLSKLDVNNRPRGSFSYSANYGMYHTDDRGGYRIYGLPEGRYLVSVGYAESPSSATITSRREFYPRVFYPNVTSESEAKVIEVSENSEATGINITVSDPKQTHDIYGQVVDDDGRPVAGVQVVIGRATKEGRYAGVSAGNGARSGPKGEFRLFGVPPGRYAILAHPDDPSGDGFFSDPVIVDISEGSVNGVEVKARQGALISGIVTIEGTNDPKVRANLSQINLGGFIRPTIPELRSPPSKLFFKVNADGSFRASGLRPGKAVISMVQTLNTRDLVIARIERNGVLAPEGIDVDVGEHVTGVRVVLVHGSLMIRGELKVVGGALPAGYKFFAAARRVDQPAQNPPGGELDARGQFIIENLPPGEYEIRVVPFHYPDGQPLSQEIRRLIASVKERVVLSGGNQQAVTLVLDLSRKEDDR